MIAARSESKEATLRTIDAIVQILKREGVEYLSCFPTTPLIEAAAQGGIRPIICRQERVGVGIADGFSRVNNGVVPGVFAMQYGPGAENSFAGVATAYSDSVPILLLPLGHAEDRQGVSPLFGSTVSFKTITKRVEQITSPGRTGDVLRRAIAALRQGRPGPVMVEVPADVAVKEVDETAFRYPPIKRTVSAGDSRDVEAAARALCAAERPIVHAGQGVLYADATAELVELAELLDLPVMTTLLGKSAFPENHPLSLGCGLGVMGPALFNFLRRADLVFGLGCSFTRHGMSLTIPAGKTLIHATNDPIDIHKDYEVAYPIIGDARLVLRQVIKACREILGPRGRPRPEVAGEIRAATEAWLAEWAPKRNSESRPISPYRVIADFARAVDPAEAIVTHDCGNPRGQIVPFYRSAGPRSFLGWGKSHALGTGLGLIMGAKLARPEKLCVNFMGDAAFGMVGLDFETAVRNRIPIVTVVLNNSGMASEGRAMPHAEAAYATSNLSGNYAEMGRAMGGYAERIEDPARVLDAFRRARRVTEEEGRPVLLEFITARETASSSPARDFKPG
ncbi:MAG: thiamine pyrophosphate-requiring protein [Chloroflexi bacterium]|nr:thiamine pyrophosphate-requiring protein [Chloroflexota bacterium]